MASRVQGTPQGRSNITIAELEEDLGALRSRGISEEEYWKLRFLIHVHDAFKAKSIPNVAVLNPNSHASLARKFSAEYTEDRDLLNRIQYHDLNFALWKQFESTGSYDVERFSTLLETIRDSDLFLLFIILDGSTNGNEPEKIRWFIKEVRKSKETRIDESWIQ